MKIGNHPEKTPLNGVANGTPSSAANPTTTPATGSASAIPSTADASAKIELSATASTLLSSGVSDEFDAEKVSRISKAIEGGTFKINHEKIADKLISNAQELLTKVQS
jgi:negative regulator of flagellin synthesis FlgM